MKRPARHLAAALCALLGALTGVAEAAPRGNVAPLAPGTDLVLPTLDQGDAIPRELLVGFRRTAEGSERAAARRAAGVQVERALRIEGVQLVTVNRGQSTREAIARLESDPAVRYAEPNRLMRASATVPNDPSFDQLWGLHNTGQLVDAIAGLPDGDIDAPEAWDLSTGGDTLVAVVDEGVAYDHPDLAPNMWSNPGEIPGNDEDDDGNGHVDDVHGIDTVDHDSDPRDFGGHGTHVAGTIAAAGDNGIGIAGVSWDAEVMAVRALGPDGGTDAEIAEAFDYAGDMGAQVVNASLGGPGESQTLQQPITDHPNTLFVVAAGNGGWDGIGDDNDGANPEFPCAYDDANLICVAATNHSDGLAGFSNFGAATVDLGAPGTNVLSAAPDRGKVVFSETFENDDFADRWTPFTDPEGGPEWSRDSGGAGGSGFSAGDSPGGDYANDAGAYMDLLVPLDLGDEHGCELSFDMKLEVRAGDQFVVYKSYDGVDFEAIGATRADLGRSTDGNFVPARLALEADGQDAVIISFGVESNGTDTADGASVDNIEVACVQPEQGEGDLAFSSGTSMATPHVSGAAALLFSHRPSLTVEQAKTILLTTGDALPSLGGKTVSGRRLNLDAALRHPAAAPAPQPQTGPASDVTASGATLGGSVNPAGAATEFYFEYGATSGYGHQTPAQPASGSQPVAVSAAVSGLAASTTYHYRVVALRGGIAFPGDDRTFTTHANPGPGPGPGGAQPATPAGTAPTGATAEPVDTLARIVNTAKVTCKRARRGLTCKVTAQGAGTVKLRLAKSGRTLARGSGQIGRTLRLSRRVKPGRYRLRVAITDSASGRSQTITRSVRVR